MDGFDNVGENSAEERVTSNSGRWGWGKFVRYLKDLKRSPIRSSGARGPDAKIPPTRVEGDNPLRPASTLHPPRLPDLECLVRLTAKLSKKKKRKKVERRKKERNESESSTRKESSQKEKKFHPGRYPGTGTSTFLI